MSLDLDDYKFETSFQRDPHRRDPDYVVHTSYEADFEEGQRKFKKDHWEMRAVTRLQRRSQIDYKELLTITKFSRSEVHIFGWYEDYGWIYLAMQYFPHGTLAPYIEKGLTEGDS